MNLNKMKTLLKSISHPLIFWILLISSAASQEKNLPLKEIILEPQKFLPQTLQQLQWIGSSNFYSHCLMIDYILGEEKETSWPKPVMDSIRGKQFKAFTKDVTDKIAEYLNGGGNLFISGAYIGSELYADTITAKFGKEILKIKDVTTHASRNGIVNSVSPPFPDHSSFKFNTVLNDSIYAVTSPGSINHTGEGEVLLRYSENQFSAGMGYKKQYGIVAFGFPFETILGEESRTDIMKAVMGYLGM